MTDQHAEVLDRSFDHLDICSIGVISSTDTRKHRRTQLDLD